MCQIFLSGTHHHADFKQAACNQIFIGLLRKAQRDIDTFIDQL
ncbi:Uncharacterised protein [Vibrio cholerae]|nr:Uncharacterised protein [Vibrio cholerae]